MTYVAQISRDAGAGSWLIAFGTIMCSVVFVMSLFRGEKGIVRLDVYSLVLALIGIALWIITSNPLTAVVLAAAVDVLGFIPTFRKAYSKPFEETTSNYMIAVVSYSLSIFALQSVNAVTITFPLTLVIIDALFVAMALVRRKQLNKKTMKSTL